ncbi:hypothetical protein N7465_000451 [Penicillium sp. CMV-2018d]|nr:hypothetical protein N7465_000451 [Penicillium sp. CMV-2018d]
MPSSSSSRGIVPRGWKRRPRIHITSNNDPSDSDSPHVLIRDEVPGKLWLVMGAGMTERAAYYGTIIMIQNYVQNSAFDKSTPGMLGMGQATASQIQYAFSFTNSITPIIGALLADSKLGRHRTILYAFPIYVAGLTLLCVVSWIEGIPQRANLAVLIISLLFMAIGSGGIRVNMNAFIGDQYTGSSLQPVQDQRGNIVQPHRGLTLQYIYSAYYWMINIGSLTGIATTMLEKKIGFGAAFTVPLIFITLGMVIFIASSKTFVKHGPSRNNLTRVWEYGIGHVRARLGIPRSNTAGDSQQLQYDDQFVQSMTDTWRACRIFATFTIPWLCWGQADNNFVSQAGEMKTSGIPNDMFYFLNPIVLVLLIPCFEKWIYPFLRARGARLTPLTRIFIGFIILTISMIYVAVLQAIIYTRGPCYKYPRVCPDSHNGSLPNDISAFAQVPVYALQSISEIFSQIAGTEYAYSQGPDDLKSVMQAMSQVFGTIASLIGVAIASVSQDPWLVNVYGSLAGAMAVSSVGFWFFFLRPREADMASSTLTMVALPPNTGKSERGVNKTTPNMFDRSSGSGS